VTRLRRRIPNLAGLAGALVVTVGVTALILPGNASAQDDSGSGSDADQASQDELIAQGQELYARGCSSCHGSDGQGVERSADLTVFGPSLAEAGELGAWFMLSTGRMPLADPDDQPAHNEPAYSEDQIDALTAYVASLGDGPELPEIDLDEAALPEGGVIYRGNCQACHSASGSGGALSYGRAAPPLDRATPEQIAAAVRFGPGQMPVFDEAIIGDEELSDLVAYVRYLRSPDDPGGLPIGRTGPIPEGFVAWLVGMVALVGCVVWIGTRSPIRPRKASKESHE
jgi:quinol---cytochrome-c reductase cytochrome c subunit